MKRVQTTSWLQRLNCLLYNTVACKFTWQAKLIFCTFCYLTLFVSFPSILVVDQLLLLNYLMTIQEPLDLSHTAEQHSTNASGF